MEENSGCMMSGAIRKKPSKFAKGSNSTHAVAGQQNKEQLGEQSKKVPIIKSATGRNTDNVSDASIQKGSSEAHPTESGIISQSSEGCVKTKKSSKKTQPQAKLKTSSSVSRQRSANSETPDIAGVQAERSCPTPRKIYNLPSGKKSGQKGKFSPKSFKFEPYIPLFEVQQGLKRGEFIEGALRINPRNYEDAYISAPDGQMDIYIGGIHDRNRALNGDLVVVQVNPKQEWKVLCDAVKDYQDRHGPVFVEEVYSPSSSPCKVHTPERFSRLQSRTSSLWNEASSPRLPDTLEIIGVDKLAEQLEEVSVQSKKKRRSKRQRMKNKNKGSETSKDSSIPPSSSASYSHGSSDDVLDQMSSANLPHQQQTSGIESNVQNGKQSSGYEPVESYNNVNSFNTEHPFPSSSKESGKDTSSTDNFVKSQNCNTNQETPWNIPEDQSSSIVTSPDVLLDFSDGNMLQQLCEQHLAKTCSSSEDNSDHGGAVIVAPDDLSGDEFTDSASSTSSASHLEEKTEDKEFFICQQDAQNNNSDSLWTQSVGINIEQHVPYFSSSRIGLGSLPVEDFGPVACQMEPVSDVPDGSNFHIQFQPNKLMKPVQSHSCAVENEFVPVISSNSGHGSPTFKTSKYGKKNVSTPKMKKRLNTEKPKAKSPYLPADKSLTTVVREVESLTVEEIMTHPLWPRFVQKTGKVVHILERKHSTIAMGHIKVLQDKNPNFALFSPKDNRFPRMMIPMSDCPKFFYQRPQDFKQFLYLARLEEWREESAFAFGRLIKSLGHVKLVDAQTEGILYENGVNFSEFAPEVLKCLPSSTEWSITDSEISRRVDYRNKCVFTIDPATARDMDDAVSFEVLENGNFEVGVHIADVTHFVREGTVLDEWAKQRATSVYLVQMVVPMLPRVLCDDLCSLTPGKDRLAFSVIWEMNASAEILSHRFEHTVINSCIKLSYEHAQEMIDNPHKKWDASEHPPIYGAFEIPSVVERVNLLHQCARQLRCKRFNNGALQLNQVKLQFSLSQETGLPLGFSVYEQKDSNRLIEEFMLLANVTVAEQIYGTFPQLALLRRHPPPQVKPMEDVVKACALMGIHLDSSSSGALQASISRYLSNDSLSNARHLVLTYMCSKPMNCALYFCTGVLKDEELFHHYALSVPLYTHFTSPIRRYPDIIVHRLLNASLEEGLPPKVEPHMLQKLANHCNDKKYNAKRVSEMSDELFLAAFIHESGTVAAQAMVIAVLDHSFDCLVLQFGIIKRIYCDKLPVIERKFKKHQGVQSLTLVWKDGDSSEVLNQTIMMFSLVSITLTTSDELQIIGTLQSPPNKLIH